MFAAGTFTAFVPTGRTVAALRALAAQARVDIEQLAAPVPSQPSLVLVAVGGAAAVALAVDLLAVGLQRPAVAGLPLLVLLAVPSGLLPGGLGWLPFTLGAAGWLGLLLVEGTDRVGRWGVPLRSAPATTAGHDPDAGSPGRVGRRIGAAALGLAAFVPAVVPGLDARLLPGSGGGDGDGGGQRTTVTYNPVTELQGQLTLPEPRTLLTYRTDDPFPDYLRLTTLDQFDGSQWRSSSLEPDQDVDDGIPTPVGLAGSTSTAAGRHQRRDRLARGPVAAAPAGAEQRRGPRPVAVGHLQRDRLRHPLQHPARPRVQRPQRAGHALADHAARGLDRPAGRARAVRRAPRTSPTTSRALTREVTRGTSTPYDAAVALQRFFRDESKGFTYEERTQNPFDDPDALLTFLEQRQGFCEQYASAMAAMLRVLGIPARVGVGFTPGTRQSDDTWVVSTDDAHAWPEAWFAGAGLGPLRAHPRRRRPRDRPGVHRGGVRAPRPRRRHHRRRPRSRWRRPRRSREGKDLDQQLERGGDTAAARRRRQRRRLAACPPPARSCWSRCCSSRSPPGSPPCCGAGCAGAPAGPLPAWAQLHDDAADVGFRWRAAESPRAAAARLAAHPGPAGGRPWTRCGGSPRERSRRATPGRAPRPRGRGSRTPPSCGAALLQGASAGPCGCGPCWRRRRCCGWAGSRTGTLLADVLDRVDDAVGAVARLLRRRGRAAA